MGHYKEQHHLLAIIVMIEIVLSLFNDLGIMIIMMVCDHGHEL